MNWRIEEVSAHGANNVVFFFGYETEEIKSVARYTIRPCEYQSAPLRFHSSVSGDFGGGRERNEGGNGHRTAGS